MAVKGVCYMSGGIQRQNCEVLNLLLKLQRTEFCRELLRQCLVLPTVFSNLCVAEAQGAPDPLASIFRMLGIQVCTFASGELESFT